MADAGTAPEPDAAPDRAGLWALPLLALGLGLTSAAVLLPEADQNRQIADERRMLAAQLDALERQAELNGEFLGRLHADPQLAGRLLHRQRPPAPDGDEVALGAGTAAGRFSGSPFALLAAEPTVAPVPAEQPGDLMARLCRHPRSRLLVLGVGLICTLIGLLSGASGPRRTLAT